MPDFYNHVLGSAAFRMALECLCVLLFTLWINHSDEKPKQNTLQPAETVFQSLGQTIKMDKLETLDIIGYTVHTIITQTLPFLREALKKNVPIRVLMIAPNSEYLIDKAELEAKANYLSCSDFYERNKRSIEKCIGDILDYVDTWEYQDKIRNVDVEIRLYHAIPVYRGVLTNEGAAVTSYFDDLKKPARDFDVTTPYANTELCNMEEKRAREWFDYLWEYRSRCYKYSLAIFDLYDTLMSKKLSSKSTQADVKIRESVVTLLAQLKKRGFKTALVVNCSDDVTDTASTEQLSKLTPYLDDVIYNSTDGEVKSPGAIYETALKRSNCVADEAIYVGSGSREKLEGVRAAGIKVIYEAAWYANREEQPDSDVRIAMTPEDLLTGIQGLK